MVDLRCAQSQHLVPGFLYTHLHSCDVKACCLAICLLLSLHTAGQTRKFLVKLYTRSAQYWNVGEHGMLSAR